MEGSTPRWGRRPLVAIHQPNFLPRLKVLQKLAEADIWCVLDSVQYSPREWQNRARIVAAHGERATSWLSIPVRRPSGRSTLIHDVVVMDPSDTSRLIDRTLRHSLRQAEAWPDVEAFLENSSSAFPSEGLTELCVGSTRSLLSIASRTPEIVLASSLPVQGKSSRLMAAICRQLGAGTYLSDSGGRNYLQVGHFDGIDVAWQDWSEPAEFSQGVTRWRDLSSVNYLARVGAERFREHVNSGVFGVASGSLLHPTGNEGS